MTQSVIMQFERLDEFTSNVEELINENIARHGAMFLCKDMVDEEPLNSLTEGDAFLIWPSSTWTGGHLGEIAVYTNGDWVFIEPVNHMNVRVGLNGAESLMTYTGSSWEWVYGADVYKSMSSGSNTLDFSYGNHLFFQFSSSGTRTILNPTENLAPGVRYFVSFYNATGSAINVTFSSTYYHGYRTIAVGAGDVAIADIMADSSGSPNVMLSKNALTGITPP